MSAPGLGCVKTRKIEKSRERSFSGKPKSVSLENGCATIDDFHRRFFCHYRARLSFYTAWVNRDWPRTGDGFGYVGSAPPKAPELLGRRETTRWARTGLLHCNMIGDTLTLMPG